ncbi:MAG: hypothetical protein ACO1RX_04460 [Candidatus Sericytochromatia bacterium]
MKTTLLTFLLGILALSGPLEAAPATPSASPSAANQDDILTTLLKDGAPPPPESAFGLPQPQLLTEPRNLLSNAMITAPGTVRLAIELKNAGKTAPIKAYVFQIVDLGLPLLPNDDQFLHQSSSPKQKSLTYTFQKPGRYSVVATVITIHGEMGSTKLNLFAR